MRPIRTVRRLLLCESIFIREKQRRANDITDLLFTPPRYTTRVLLIIILHLSYNIIKSFRLRRRIHIRCPVRIAVGIISCGSVVSIVVPSVPIVSIVAVISRLHRRIRPLLGNRVSR